MLLKRCGGGARVYAVPLIGSANRLYSSIFGLGARNAAVSNGGAITAAA